MAKTDYVYLSGKAKWINTTVPDKFGNWGLVLYLDAKAKETWLDLKKRGILNEISQDDDGEFVRLRRPQERKFKDGRVMGMSPVTVVDKAGVPLLGNAVGNGSDVTCKLEAYAYKPPFKKEMGYAIRLAAIRVDNLIPFEPKDPNAFDPHTAKAVEGLRDAPEPIF